MADTQGEIRSGTRRLSHTDLRTRAAKAASGLAQLGVGQGDTVALYLRNDFACFEVCFAANLLGAYPVAVNWHYTEPEARFLFNDCSPKVIVIHADLVPAIRGAFPADAIIFVVSTPAEICEAYDLPTGSCAVPQGMTDWDDWREQQTPLPHRSLEVPGTMIYTSGTTGRPKGVRRAPPTADQVGQWLQMGVHGFGFAPYVSSPEEIVTVITGPMYHSAPNTYGLIAVRIGATVILQPRFAAERLLELIQTLRVTHLHMVPVMFSRLLKLSPQTRRQFDLSSLRYVIHGAAPCPPQIKRRMIEWLGPVINEYYASTETGMVTVCSTAEWLEHPGTVGRPMPGASVRVVDVTGCDVPAGVVGEITCALRGVADFTYHGDDSKRRDVARNDLVTLGDLGYLDADGFLYVCDRVVDLIISGGVNIYSAEIEAVLAQMPEVGDCAVFGIPDDEFGESVCAAIQLQEGVSATAQDVREFLRSRLAGFKIPRRIDFAAALPREESGKIFKRKLRDPFWNGIGRRI